jgi:hypothetical protein
MGNSFEGVHFEDKSKWEGNIKMDFKEIGSEAVNWLR